jgi:hypothetical protein
MRPPSQQLIYSFLLYSFCWTFLIGCVPRSFTDPSSCPFLRPVAGGGPEGGAHFAPFGAKRPCRPLAVWSHRCADTSNRRARFQIGRGQPVGPALATSSDGGGIAADPTAARPVQVLVALRPGCSVTAQFENGPQRCLLSLFRCPPAYPPRSCSRGFGPIGGLAI